MLHSKIKSKLLWINQQKRKGSNSREKHEKDLPQIAKQHPKKLYQWTSKSNNEPRRRVRMKLETTLEARSPSSSGISSVLSKWHKSARPIYLCAQRAFSLVVRRSWTVLCVQCRKQSRRVCTHDHPLTPGVRIVISFPATTACSIDASFRWGWTEVMCDTRFWYVSRPQKVLFLAGFIGLFGDC